MYKGEEKNNFWRTERNSSVILDPFHDGMVSSINFANSLASFVTSQSCTIVMSGPFGKKWKYKFFRRIETNNPINASETLKIQALQHQLIY